MKRLLVIAVLAAVLTALLATTALAAGPGPGRWAQEKAPNAGTCPMGMAGRQGPAERPGWAGQPDAVETLLGMTQEEIHAERAAGKSLAQIAASKGVSADTLVETILTAKTTAIQQAVTDGKLTQEQANLMIERMTAQVKVMVERTTTGPMMGGRGHGMRGQMGPGAGTPGTGTPGAGMRGLGMRGGFNF